MLNANLVLNLRISDDHSNRDLPLAQISDPVTRPKRPESLSHRFVKRISGDLNAVFVPPQIATRHFAGADAHSSIGVFHYRVSVRSDSLAERSGFELSVPLV
jgi:hypothetical protein